MPCRTPFRLVQRWLETVHLPRAKWLIISPFQLVRWLEIIEYLFEHDSIFNPDELTHAPEAFTKYISPDEEGARMLGEAKKPRAHDSAGLECRTL